MKKLNISDVTNSVAMPIKAGTLQFLQDAHKEALSGVISNIIESPIIDTIYILSGCSNTAVAPIHTLSAGVLFVNGEVFDFDGATFTLTGLQKAFARIETTQYTTNADPVQFTDGNSRNVHNIRKIVIEATTVSSSLPEFKDFVTVGHWKSITNLLKADITALQLETDVLQNEITALQSYLPKNKGFISGLDLPFASGSLTVGGDITSATGSGSGVLITMTNAMPNMNYYLRSFIESLGTYTADTEIRRESFRKVSTTQFYYIQSETNSQTQNLKIHFEAVTY